MTFVVIVSLPPPFEVYLLYLSYLLHIIIIEVVQYLHVFVLSVLCYLRLRRRRAQLVVHYNQGAMPLYMQCDIP